MTKQTYKLSQCETPLSEFDKKVVEILPLDLLELSKAIWDQHSRSQAQQMEVKVFNFLENILLI